MYSDNKICMEENKRVRGNNGMTVSLGSCFSTEMGNRMEACGYRVCNNPFGVLYNPVSIARSLGRLADGRPFTSDDVILRDTNPRHKRRRGQIIAMKEPVVREQCHVVPAHRPIAPDGGGYVSFWHHGSFARKTPEEFLDNANAALARASADFREAGTVIVTFGTAWVFRHLERDIIVSNCHKHPAWEFRRERLAVEDIVALWNPVLDRFSSKRFVFTVSPVRHLKDGLHGNQLSKSILLLAVDALVQSHSNAEYFPAYEIVLDELRDYSWFGEDTVHPTAAAVDMVWERFSAQESL